MPVPSKPFTFVNGPGNLIDATQVNSDFDTLYNALNNALDESNIADHVLTAQSMNAAFAKDVVEPAFSGWKPLIPQRGGGSGNTSKAAGTYLLGMGNGLLDSTNFFSYAINPEYIDPADLVAGSRTAQFRVRAQVLCNQQAPGITFTFGLYTLTLNSGAAGQSNMYTPSLVAGSTVAFASPAASSSNVSASAAFSLPGGAARTCVLGVTLSGSLSGNASTDLLAGLYYKQV